MTQRHNRTAGRSCQTIASFLLKTYQILDHPQFQSIISWDRDNIGFVVKDVLAFTRQILPKYFRHSNFSSFVRQLNMYDFHKVKQDNDSLVFKNPLFKKGEQFQLKQIRRKASKRQFPDRKQTGQRDRNNSQTQKYINTLKSLKKIMEGEINQSCTHFENSLHLLEQNNTSNSLKLRYIKQLESTDECSLDNLFKLKEQCFKYFNKIQDWINQNIDIQNRKLKLANNYLNQIQKRQELNGDIQLESRKNSCVD